MRVLVTGAQGFIGSFAVRALLREGAEVIAWVRDPSRITRIQDVASRLRIVSGDFLDGATQTRVLDESKPEACMHLAWTVVPGQYLTTPDNLDHVRATLAFAPRLLEAGCRRLVGIGTCFEYDTSVGYLRETSPTAPATLYAASKLATFTALRAWAEPRDMSFAWARIFYQYGPWEDERRLVPVMAKPLLSGQRAKAGEGLQVRDFLHVADVGRALAAILLSKVTGIVNVGSGQPVTVRDICLAIADATHARDRLDLGVMPTRPGDPPFVCANVERLMQETSFRPEYDLKRGIAETTGWWANQLTPA